MDYEKYYKIDPDGSFTVHFLNKKGLDVDDIKKIFSPYGNVLTINGTKNEYGLKFVKYKTLEEIKCCFKGLQGNSTIQLLPEKSKMNDSSKSMDKRDSSQPQAARTENSHQKVVNTGKQFNSNFTHNAKLNLEEDSIHMRISNGHNRFDNSDNFSDTNYQNFMHGCKPNLHIVKCDELESLVSNGKPSLSSRQTTMENNFSDTTMDYEKYYRISRDGTYTVHFPNKKGKQELSLDQIKELFSSYGNVISVHGGGNNNGLRFVRYKTEEEIKRCIEGFQNSNVITILPQKDKINGETKKDDQKDSNQWQPARMEDTSQKTFSTDKQFNSNSFHNEKFSETEKKPIHNTKAFDLDNNFEDANNFSDTGSQNSRQSYISNVNDVKHVNLSPHTSNEKYSFSRQWNSINNEGTLQDYDLIMREKQGKTRFHSLIKTDTNTKMDRNMQISTYSEDKMPALVCDTEMNSKEFDTMSDSSLSSGIRFSLSKPVIIPMQEIIVANIHANYGVHYILHLFEKHSPISATFVKTIFETNIRYCHVYFKTIQDAVAIEEEFDNFDMSGKNLIVLRKSRLIDETICK